MSTGISWPPIGGSPYDIPAAGEVNWAELSDFLIALAAAQTTTAQKWGARVATTSPVTVGSASDCLVAVNLSVPGPTTVNLPAGVVGQMFAIVDDKKDASTNNITIVPNGSDTIQGLVNYVLNQDGASVGLVFRGGGNWAIVYQAAGEGGGGGITRSALDAGSPGYVVINASPSGLMSEEQYLSPLRGGLGQDASAYSGVLKFTAGIASASPLVNGDIDPSANIDASKLGTGIVSTTEFNYLDGLSGSIQTQLNSKEPTITVLPIAKGGTNSSVALTNSKVMVSTAGSISESAVTTTELSYLTGVASSIQTQLNGKEPTITTLGINRGGTGQTTAAAAFAALSPLTTKGDIIGFSTLPVRLAVGTNDQVLTADSTTASGLAWKAGGGAGGLTPVAITSSGTVTTNTIENVTLSGAPLTRTLPSLPLGGQQPISILILDAGRTASAVNYIRIQPASGEPIDGLAVNVPIDIDYVGGWVFLSASAGAGSWKIQTQATTTYVPGFQPGYTGSTAIGSGNIGQVILGSRVRSSALSLTNATPANITSISVTPGVWDIVSSFSAEGTGATSTLSQSATSIVSATLPSVDTFSVQDSSGQKRIASIVNLSGSVHSIETTSKGVLVTVTTTFYLVSQVAFTAGSVTGYGSIVAERVA